MQFVLQPGDQLFETRPLFGLVIVVRFRFRFQIVSLSVGEFGGFDPANGRKRRFWRKLPDKYRQLPPGKGFVWPIQVGQINPVKPVKVRF